jgi:EAL domain-containing protein (putative c-di-GMP-specific phosphodiesterase class I)
VRFSIDDFGTGYSSLAYLKRLPLHELKIDRSLVQDTPHDSDDTAIIKMILSMARHLNLNVVAEGVETREQTEFLVANQCHVLQGYFYSRPEALAPWLASLLARTRQEH